MRAAAQAYRPRWQAYAYGRGVRHYFRSPTYIVPGEPGLLRTIHHQRSDYLHLIRYQHQARQPRATVSEDPGDLPRYPVNDSSSEAQPSGIGGVFAEDSVMYYEYESGILRFPGARGLFTAALRVNASNAKSPLSGTYYPCTAHHRFGPRDHDGDREQNSHGWLPRIHRGCPRQRNCYQDAGYHHSPGRKTAADHCTV